MKTKNKYILCACLMLGLIGIDLITKVLCEGINVSVIPNFFSLISVHNYGAGLGILSGKTALLIVMSVVLLAVFVLYDIFCKRSSVVYVVGLSFIFAGAIGNLIDRIAFGYVRDFLYFNIKIMPYYFNVADALLTIGLVLFVVDLLFLGKKNSKQQVGKQEEMVNNKKEINNTNDGKEVWDDT